MPFISTVTGSLKAGRRATAFSTPASDWSPATDINALGWIDASDTSSYTTSGSNLTAVTDKSGTYTMDINNTPTVNNTLNSLPVFTFANDNESLKSTTYEQVVSNSGNHWAIGVFRWDSVNNNKDSFWSYETNGSPKRDYAVSSSSASNSWPGELDLDGLSSNRISSTCLLYTSPSPRDQRGSRMPSSA